MKRKEIDFKQSIRDVIVEMSEGIPGAIRVLSQLAFTDPTLLVALDDMNIRGSQVWLGYKDHCGEKLEVFTRCIRERNELMVATINNASRKLQPKAVKAVGHDERKEIV